MNPLLAGVLTPEEKAEYQQKKLEKQKNLAQALNRVLAMAQKDTGGGRVCRDFLLSLYNGNAYPFNMNKLRNLDSGLFNACIAIMQIDCRPFPPKEIHEYWANGDQIFQQLKASRKQEEKS